jgi:DNA topoisomerase VI subunit A
MDVKTLEENRKYWKKLTQNDTRRLNLLLKESLTANCKETIEFMIKNYCKLEQESLSLKVGEAL